MKQILKYRSASITVFIIFLCLFFFTTCMNNTNNQSETTVTASSSEYEQYAGSASCVKCHQSVYESHINTAHFQTSALASAKTIKGSFEPGHNTFSFKNGGVVEMQNKGAVFFQAAYLRGVEKIRQPFDIVTGSGTKGQTYLSWTGVIVPECPIKLFISGPLLPVAWNAIQPMQKKYQGREKIRKDL